MYTVIYARNCWRVIIEWFLYVVFCFNNNETSLNVNTFLIEYTLSFLDKNVNILGYRT